MVINLLCTDIIQHICFQLDIEVLEQIRQVSKQFYLILNDKFYKMFAKKVWGEEFWKKAMKRPIKFSKPLKTWREELIRLELFQRMVEKNEKKRWRPHQFYVVWAFET